MKREEFVSLLNAWSRESLPFFFLIDFEMQKPVAIPLEQVDPDEILFDFNGISNARNQQALPLPVTLTCQPPSLESYRCKFDKVMAALRYGDSFLANLTIKTEVSASCGLRDIFFGSRAKYRLWFRDQFVVFSPETFVQIRDNRIYAHPMKGTIDASIPQAREKIRSDPKETAEHVTITDLIRNDLSRVATNVRVNRFRYIDKIATQLRTLLQVSSEISGELTEEFQGRAGDVLMQLLPAGSISGAPKARTVTVLQDAEQEPRGYYTGVAGVFDGSGLDAAVLIRYIERHEGKLFYRSGGGITTQSQLESEYKETLDKIYVPFG